MKPCILYFSRTGNTKRMAEAIAESIKAPVFAITHSDPAAAKDFDLLILGTPVEAFRPAKELMRFVEQLPNAEGKKAILFCTYMLWRGSTFKILEKKLASKGYKTILSVSKRGMRPGKHADFSDSIAEIRQVLGK